MHMYAVKQWKVLGTHLRAPCLEQARSTAVAERADLALRQKHTLADEREAADALAAHERKRTDAREAEAAAELARACDKTARLHAELEEQRKGQERAADQIRREREAEASRHNLPWVFWITSSGCCSAGCFYKRCTKCKHWHATLARQDIAACTFEASALCGFISLSCRKEHSVAGAQASAHAEALKIAEEHAAALGQALAALRIECSASAAQCQELQTQSAADQLAGAERMQACTTYAPAKLH